LGTIRHADCIFVIKDSELVERGTHEELLAAGGTYAELYKIQASQGAEQDPAEHAIEKPVA
jgi:ATP-binding cassette subfamily B protein